MTDALQAFSRFKADDFEVLHLDNLFQDRAFRLIDLAQIVINASREGSKPVNFRLRTAQEYWMNWTVIGGDGRLLLAALDHLGYGTSYQTNGTSDGFYLLLQKKPIPAGTPSPQNP